MPSWQRRLEDDLQSFTSLQKMNRVVISKLSLSAPCRYYWPLLCLSLVPQTRRLALPRGQSSQAAQAAGGGSKPARLNQLGESWKRAKPQLASRSFLSQGPSPPFLTSRGPLPSRPALARAQGKAPRARGAGNLSPFLKKPTCC